MAANTVAGGVHVMHQADRCPCAFFQAIDAGQDLADLGAVDLIEPFRGNRPCVDDDQFDWHAVVIADLGDGLDHLRHGIVGHQRELAVHDDVRNVFVRADAIVSAIALGPHADASAILYGNVDHDAPARLSASVRQPLGHLHSHVERGEGLARALGPCKHQHAIVLDQFLDHPLVFDRLARNGLERAASERLGQL